MATKLMPPMRVQAPPGQLASSVVIASLSRALDLAEGEPMGHAIRSCWLGMQIAKWLELRPAERQDLYYALLLKDAGCSANAYSVTHWFQADDLATKAELKITDWSSQWRSMLFAIRQTAPSAPITRRMAQLVSLGSRGTGLANELVEVRSTRGAEMVRQLGWAEPAAAAVLSLDEHWNGAGRPRGRKGEEIPLLSRIVLLSQTVEIFWRRGGGRAAETVLRQRRGKWFDPVLVDLVLAHAGSSKLWRQLSEITHPEHVGYLDPEPRAIPSASMDDMIRIGEVFAAVVDAKSPWTTNHSTRTAAIARLMAENLNFTALEQDRVGLAGLLHDLGKLAVSNAILDKAGPLLPEEMEEMQRHTSITHDILSPLWPLDDVAEMAASHHERLDGTGYHRHLRGPEMPHGAEILAVADVYEALTAHRPYRRGMDGDEAIAVLKKDQGTRLSGEPITALEQMVASKRQDEVQ
ncbi:MAG TPA: HD domain-containing phosphohydrolase [Candidatus Acidoferrales bacterium]|nr:HD domain-containing phosphohydrolase [Candidatus Acidoferrales bacterium]